MLHSHQCRGTGAPKGLSSFLFTRLKVINRLDDGINGHCWFDIVYDIIHTFVCHRAFIERASSNRCSVDTFHLLLELRNCECLFRRAAAHQTPSSMRRRDVPVFISFAGTQQTTVSHVDRNQ